MPQKEYLLGSRTCEYVAATKTVSFDSEVIGIKLVTNSLDIEGIAFLESNGTMQRIGEDEAYSPVATDFTMLNGRFIGLSGKFMSEDGACPTQNIVELGIIIDERSTFTCKENVYESALF